jgi:hypothetical protein
MNSHHRFLRRDSELLFGAALNLDGASRCVDIDVKGRNLL